jgi:hypothetical protein
MVDRVRSNLHSTFISLEEESFVTRKSFLSQGIAAIVFLTTRMRGQDSPQQPSAADQKSIDQDVEMMRKDVRSQKKQIIAANLQLTDAESTKFWPVYDQYTAELVKINDAKYGAIKDYAANYNSMTDDKALALTKQVLGVDQSVAQLRMKYVPVFAKVIPGKKTAYFFQLDRRLVGLIDLQLASEIPMVQQS